MSYYSLPARTSTGASAVTVGWHRLFATFVIHVQGANKATLVDRGDPYDRITDPQVVVTTAHQWALVPPDLADELAAAQHHCFR